MKKKSAVKLIVIFWTALLAFLPMAQTNGFGQDEKGASAPACQERIKQHLRDYFAPRDSDRYLEKTAYEMLSVIGRYEPPQTGQEPKDSKKEHELWLACRSLFAGCERYELLYGYQSAMRFRPISRELFGCALDKLAWIPERKITADHLVKAYLLISRDYEILKTNELIPRAQKYGQEYYGTLPSLDELEANLPQIQNLDLQKATRKLIRVVQEGDDIKEMVVLRASEIGGASYEANLSNLINAETVNVYRYLFSFERLNLKKSSEKVKPAANGEVSAVRKIVADLFDHCLAQVEGCQRLRPNDSDISQTIGWISSKLVVLRSNERI